jgi:hypothetical protein
MIGNFPALFNNLHIHPDYSITPFSGTASWMVKFISRSRSGPKYRNPILKTFPAEFRNSMRPMIFPGGEQSYGAGTV